MKTRKGLFLVLAASLFGAALCAFLASLGFGWGGGHASRAGDVVRDGAAVAEGGRQITFDEGKIRFSVDTYPRLGSPDARHVLVELFDYQCISCRVMSGYLKALVEAYPEQVAVVLVPVPMDGACNPFLRGAGEYEGSCGISRIALALWAESPENFAAFHEALIREPSEAMARDLASPFLGESRIREALEDKELGRVLEHNIAAWRRVSGSSGSLPKLLISDRRILHGMPASRSAFLDLMKHELSLD